MEEAWRRFTLKPCVSMLNLAEARSLVQQELDKNIDPNSDDRWVILEQETIERDWGWVFFYQSQAYMETGGIDDMLAGNAPYIVNKHSGKLQLTGTAHDIEYYIDEYEQSLR